MATLSSRPNQPASSAVPTQQELLEAAQPSINILQWLTSRMQFGDNAPHTIAAAVDVIEEALDCMMLCDYAVSPVISPRTMLTFDIAIKPLEVNAFVFFQISFQVISPAESKRTGSK